MSTREWRKPPDALTAARRESGDFDVSITAICTMPCSCTGEDMYVKIPNYPKKIDTHLYLRIFMYYIMD